ncbi:unnamed protein product [Urochloa humidicola]
MYRGWKENGRHSGEWICKTNDFISRLFVVFLTVTLAVNLGLPASELTHLLRPHMIFMDPVAWYPYPSPFMNGSVPTVEECRDFIAEVEDEPRLLPSADLMWVTPLVNAW